MKRIFILAAFAFCVFAADAQNKIFAKYARMQGVDYVCLNQNMLGTGLSAADTAITDSPYLPKLTDFNRMLIITAKGDAIQTLFADIQSLAKDKRYEIRMQSHSAAGEDALFLYSDKVSPVEYIICNTTPSDCSVLVMLRDK